MNGVHDVGGMHGFGPVEREENEPLFHADREYCQPAQNAKILMLVGGEIGTEMLDLLSINKVLHSPVRFSADGTHHGLLTSRAPSPPGCHADGRARSVRPR